MRQEARPDWEPPHNPVLVLTQHNFTSVLRGPGGPVLVEFFAPWCGHCKRMAPEFKGAAADLRRMGVSVRLAKVDATEEVELAQRYGISGYPTLKLFRGEREQNYTGGRDRQSVSQGGGQLSHLSLSSLTPPPHSPPSSLTPPPHSPLLLTHPSSSLTPPHSPLLLTHPSSSLTPPPHSPLLLTHPSSSLTPPPHSTLLLTHPSSSLTPPPHSPLLLTQPLLTHPSSSLTPPPHSPLLLTHPSSSLTPPPHSPLLLTHPSSSLTPPPHLPPLLTHPSSSLTPPPHSPLLLTHPSSPIPPLNSNCTPLTACPHCTKIKTFSKRLQVSSAQSSLKHIDSFHTHFYAN